MPPSEHNGLLTHFLTEQFRDLKSDLAEHRREVRQDLNSLRGEFKENLEGLKSEFKTEVKAANDASKPGSLFATKAQGAFVFITFAMSAVGAYTALHRMVSGS